MGQAGAREEHHGGVIAGAAPPRESYLRWQRILDAARQTGAEAVHPYLAMETLLAASELPEDKRGEKAVKNYVKAIGKGLLKVMSKMGISTYQSYCGAQIFDAVGLSSELIEQYFTGTATTIEGIGLTQVGEETVRRHQAGDKREEEGDHVWLVDAGQHIDHPLLAGAP